ncbi:MAG TPA: hypothetical protein VJ933_05905 [Phaeodactylibacter sp.]|nr:hypothetical protein [Phaeodactylibacter sp.]
MHSQDMVADSGLSTINWLELRIKGSENESEFEAFLYAFLKQAKLDYDVYLFFYERSPSLKSTLRSHTKLFYDLKREHLINPSQAEEQELSIDDKHSLMTGVIYANSIADDVIVNELILNGFRFGLLERKKNKPLKTQLSHFISCMDTQLLQLENLVELNHIALLERFLHPEAIAFTYIYDGKNDLVLDLYAGDVILEKTKNLIISCFPEGASIPVRSASRKEVDGLIANYFNHWGRSSRA